MRTLSKIFGGFIACIGCGIIILDAIIVKAIGALSLWIATLGVQIVGWILIAGTLIFLLALGLFMIVLGILLCLGWEL